MNDNSRAVPTVPWIQLEADVEEDHRLGQQMTQKVFNLELIQDIQKEVNLFRLMTASLCPEIYGQTVVKSALVLALFGGVEKVNFICQNIQTSAQIHVLLFGDHGSNKDLLLKAVHSIAPKGVYICGNTATTNSLTVSLKKRKTALPTDDTLCPMESTNTSKNVWRLKSHKTKTKEITEEYFEKGLLISNTFLVSCVDQFERMNGIQHQVIQEVIEYQTLSIYKSSKYREMRAKTSIIAAVNPINGCYDWSLNVWQNTKLNKTLISKFDLIFNLVDSPDGELDSKISKDILDSLKSPENNEKLSQKRSYCSQSISTDRFDNKLVSKLTYRADEEQDLIPHQLITEYVEYAQRYCHPIISSEAEVVLNRFSSEIAKTEISKSKKRQLESLYRLTEARARLELRSEATVEDAEDVIEMIRHSIGKHYFAPNYVNQMKCFPTFENKPKKQNTKYLLKALQIFSDQSNEKVFSVQQIVEISETFKIPFDSKEEILNSIDKLNNDCHLVKNGSEYKFI